MSEDIKEQRHTHRATGPASFSDDFNVTSRRNLGQNLFPIPSILSCSQVAQIDGLLGRAAEARSFFTTSAAELSLRPADENLMIHWATYGVIYRESYGISARLKINLQHRWICLGGKIERRRQETIL